MMIGSMILETISDSFMLIIVILTVKFLTLDSDALSGINKQRMLISLIISCIISILFSLNFFILSTKFRWLLICINFSKYIFLAFYIYKRISIKSITVSFIIQVISSLLASGLIVVIQTELIDKKPLISVILLLFVRLILMIIILILNKKSEYYITNSINKMIPAYVYILILLSMFLLSGLIQTTNFTTINENFKVKLINIFTSMLSISITAVILSLLFNVVSKNYQSDINEMLKRQVASQLYHYNYLEKINTEIRSFKHDYINHMKCIRSMVSNKEYDDLLAYLNNLVSSFPISSFLYNTGNYVADAILTEKQVNSSADISIEFNGIIPANIDNTDLCIILSNALDNAIEACCLCNCDKIINVYSGFKHGYFVLKIKNPTANIITDNKFTTTKLDKINHGFGLANIKRTVRKYNGYVATKCENNIFSLNITFMSISNDV